MERTKLLALISLLAGFLSLLFAFVGVMFVWSLIVQSLLLMVGFGCGYFAVVFSARLGEKKNFAAIAGLVFTVLGFLFWSWLGGVL